MPVYMLRSVEVSAVMTAQVRRHANRADRLTRYVQKVYPYAVITSKLLDEYGPDVVALMRGIKQAWDPKSILNPGKIF